VPETLAEIQANLDFAQSVNGAEGGRIRPMMTPHGPETHTPETLRAVMEGARKLGNGIHTHLRRTGSAATTWAGSPSARRPTSRRSTSPASSSAPAPRRPSR